MNKKFLYSAFLIVIVALVSISGTYAYFTASRTSNVNKFVTGTLDLNVEANDNNLEPIVIENLGDGPGISGSKTWKIKNTGSLPGRLLLRLQNVVNSENGCNDQEELVDPTCNEEGKQGDLGGLISLKIALDGVDQVESTLSSTGAEKIATDWMALDDIIMEANEERTVTAYWFADEDSYGNEIQSDGVEFDLNFRLIQNINGIISN